MPTLAQVIASAREISFDRYVTPTFYIKGSSGDSVEVSSTALVVSNNGSPVSTFSYTDYPTLSQLATAIIADPRRYEFSYSSSFIGVAASSFLMSISASTSIEKALPVYRTYFFDDQKIYDLIKRYYAQYLNYRCGDIDALDLVTDVATLMCQRPNHLAMVLAYWLVENRRLYELAAEAIGQTTFNGSDGAPVMGLLQGGANIRMNIGEAFTLEQSPQSESNVGEEPWRVGADNVLGDANGFWYKLQLWIRDQIEVQYGDISLRKDTVVMGKMDYEKDINFYGYYDQYPYTISPLTRDILSSFNW